jgi:hypothetical protein
MSLVANHVSADSGKNLDPAIVVDLCPEDVLRVILSDTVDDIARATKIFRLDRREHAIPQILPDELENLREVVWCESADDLRT